MKMAFTSKGFQLSQGLCSAAVTHAFEKSVDSLYREQASQPPALGAGATEKPRWPETAGRQVADTRVPWGLPVNQRTGWNQLFGTLGLLRCSHTRAHWILWCL